MGCNNTKPAPAEAAEQAKATSTPAAAPGPTQADAAAGATPSSAAGGGGPEGKDPTALKAAADTFPGTPAENQAATKLQAVQRGRTGRRRAAKKKKQKALALGPPGLAQSRDPTAMQAAAATFPGTPAENTAATKLQAVQRGRQCRKTAAIADALSGVDLFAALSPRDMRQLVGRMAPRCYLSGADICVEGEIGDCMYFIAEGTVGFWIGGNKIDFEKGANTYFGEVALMHEPGTDEKYAGSKRTATARALVTSKILILGQAAFKEVMEKGGGDVLKQNTQNYIQKDVDRAAAAAATINELRDKKQGKGGGGAIDSAQIVRLIVQTALEPEEEGGKRVSCQSLFETIDVDDSGEIDMEEFTTFVKEQAAKKPSGPQPTDKEIETAFAFIDTDASGEISSMEFHAIFAGGE